MAIATSDKIVLSKEGDIKKDIILDYSILKKAVLVLRAINHKLRRQIISLIEENKKISVTAIYVKLRLEQSVASQHLAILRRAGIVTTTRDGKQIYYSLNKKRIQEIVEMLPVLAEIKVT